MPYLSSLSRRSRTFWTNLPLRLKGFVVVAIPLAGLLGVSVAAYILQRMDWRMDAEVDRTTEALWLTEHCRAEFWAGAAMARPDPLGVAAASLDACLSELEKLLWREPDQVERLRRLRNWHQWHSAPAVPVPHLMAELDALRAEHRRLLALESAAVARLRIRKLVVLTGHTLVGLAGGLLAVLLYTSGVTRRMALVQQNAARLVQHLPPLPQDEGRDEIGTLNSTIERAGVSLRQSEDERDRLFTLSMDMLCVMGLDGGFKRVNPAFSRILGYTEADLLSKNIAELAHPDCRQGVQHRMLQLAEGKPVNLMECAFVCADGATKWLAWSVAPFVSEGTAYGVARDRTPQKQDERILRQSHDRLVCFLESTTDAFFAVDRSWRVLTVNRQAERLWGRQRQNLLGRILWDLFPEAIGGPFYGLYERAMQTGAPGHIAEFYPPMQRWFEVHAYPSPEGLSVYFRDFTDRRAAEEKIQRALQEKEVLLREVHHRVKNNLQVICSMLRLQAGYVNDRGLLQVLRECRERVLAMAMLHDQLHRAKDLSQINLGEYIRNLASSVFCSYGVNSAQIELRVDVEDLTVAIDTAIPCGLIAQELLSNCLRHAFPEGQKGRVWVMLRGLPGDRMELTVCDDGRGFPESAGAPARSLGLRLVDLFAQQIEATVERSGKTGALCRLVFQGKKSKGEELQ